jgi:hypothetical protein
LAILTTSFGVTGYSLPWDQIGYWAVKIVTDEPKSEFKLVRVKRKNTFPKWRMVNNRSVVQDAIACQNIPEYEPKQV